MKIAKALFLLAAVSLSINAHADISGTWSGNFSATLPCIYKEGRTIQFAGPFTMFISQAPDASGRFAGTIVSFAAFPDNLLCQARPADSLPLNINGTVKADGSITDTVMLSPGIGAFRPTGSQKDNTLTLSGPSDNGGSITLNAVRVDPDEPPKFRVAGQYVGTYTSTANYSYRCSDVGNLTSSGTILISLADVGRGVTGGVRFQPLRSAGLTRASGECFVDNQENANSQLLGTLTAGSDKTMTGFIGFQYDQVPFTATFDLRTLKGTAVTPGGGKLEFDLKNTSPVVPPDIRFFDAEQTPIVKGESTRLRWKVNYADKVTIDNGIGDQPPTGSVVIRPDQSTVYTLTAVGPDATSQRTFTVSVLSSPNVGLGSFPRAILERPNEAGGTDTFTLINRGFVTSDVTLTTNDDFFTIDTPTFSLPAGTARTITLTGKARPVGAYTGTITIAASGGNPPIPTVRVLMVVANIQPGGKLESTVSRVEVSSTQGTNATGSVAFKNTGTAPVIGIATASAPFIVPQAGIVTIPPGQTLNVNYTIDARQRPIDNPLGALSGTISLRFPGSGSTGPTAFQAAPSTGSGSVNVTLVHVSSPLTGPGIPAPLSTNELAVFAPGLGNKSTAIGDLLLGNKQATPLQQFALFVAGSAGSSSAASIPQLSANTSVELPGLLKNVVSSDNSSGTAQIRGVDASKVSVAAVQSNTSLPVGTFSTALPIFRSDRAVAPGSPVVLSGLQKGSATQTSLFVQEMSGTDGSYTIDFMDATGRVVSSRASQSIGGFGFAELADVVPANATSARLMNSSSAAKLSAYALVTNPGTGDAWLVTDPSAGASETAYVIPIFKAGNNAETLLYATNRSSGGVTVDVQGATAPKTPPRRRAVRNSEPDGADLTRVSTDTMSIAPMETKSVPITATSGFVRVSGPAGSISAVGRSTITSGSSIFGTGLPAVPISAALAAGQGRRFSAVDDAGDASRTAATPATFRTNMELVETAGSTAVVRLTLQFAVATGSKVTSTARVTKEYPVAANGFVLINDLAQDIIGASRPSIGDIRNATLDVDVISGSGRVVPFMASTDNGSGDLIVRTE